MLNLKGKFEDQILFEEKVIQVLDLEKSMTSENMATFNRRVAELVRIVAPTFPAATASSAPASPANYIPSSGYRQAGSMPEYTPVLSAQGYPGAYPGGMAYVPATYQGAYGQPHY